MKQGRRRIVLTPHFKQRWRERIGEDGEGVMRRVLQSALLEKVSLHHRFHYFSVDIRGRRAVFAVDLTGSYGFVTVLGRGMKVEGVDEDEGANSKVN